MQLQERVQIKGGEWQIGLFLWGMRASLSPCR